MQPEAAWITLPPSKRISIYEETLSYHRRNPNQSIAAVRRYIQNKHQMRISYYAVHRWISGQHDPRKRFNVPEDANGRLSYLLGATLSDGCCHANPNRSADRSIILSVTDYDYAVAFAEAAARTFRKTKRCAISYSQGRYRVEFNSVLFYDLVSKGTDSFRPLVYAYPGPFIRGFFDGDGDVTTSVSKGKLQVCLRVTNSNTEYLRLLYDLLRRFFDISGSIHLSHLGPREAVIERRHVFFRKPTYVLKIDGLNQLVRFATLIGFEIKRKQQKLVDATQLIRTYGTRSAATEWARLYEKKNGFWRKKGVSRDYGNAEEKRGCGRTGVPISSLSGISLPH